MKVYTARYWGKFTRLSHKKSATFVYVFGEINYFAVEAFSLAI